MPIERNLCQGRTPAKGRDECPRRARCSQMEVFHLLTAMARIAAITFVWRTRQNPARTGQVTAMKKPSFPAPPTCPCSQERYDEIGGFPRLCLVGQNSARRAGRFQSTAS